MRRAAYVLLFLAASLSAQAGRELGIGAYTTEIRRQVIDRLSDVFKGAVAEVSGVVTYADDEKFFLQCDDDGLKVFVAQTPPAIGDRITVVGMPSLEGGHIVFVAKDWQLISKGELPLPRLLTSAELVATDEQAKGVHGLRVAIEGRVVGPTESGFAVDVEGVPVTVATQTTPDYVKGSDLTHPKVCVVGVVEQVLDQSTLFGASRYVLGLKLNVRSVEDVTLLPDMAYLLRRRSQVVDRIVLVVIIVLGLGLLLAAVLFLRQRRRLFRSRTIMRERKRMADDLHDTIEQHLVGAKMLLGLGRVKEAQDVLVRAKREIRDIVWGLKNDDMMRLTPAEMLRQLAHDENTKGLCRVDTKLDAGLPAALDAAEMRDLSLIVREAMGNAVKHGGAKKLAMSSDPCEGGGWVLRISNDGAPFDPENVPGAAEGHFGLEGMRQRARRLGATVSFARRKEGMVLVLEKNK